MDIYRGLYYPIYWGLYIGVQEGNPVLNQPGLNGMMEGFWTLLIWTLKNQSCTLLLLTSAVCEMAFPRNWPTLSPNGPNTSLDPAALLSKHNVGAIRNVDVKSCRSVVALVSSFSRDPPLPNVQHRSRARPKIMLVGHLGSATLEIEDVSIWERFPRNMATPNHCRCLVSNFGCWVAMAMPHFRPAGSLGSLGSARWECLKHAIHQIHEHNASSLSFEEPMAEPMADGRPWRIWQMGLSEMGCPKI